MGKEDAGFMGRKVEDKDWMRALDSKEFKEFMKLIDELYEKRKSGVSEEGQSDDYKDLKSAVERKYRNIHDRRIKKVIDSVLRDRGIDINEGHIDMKDAESADPNSIGLFSNEMEKTLRGTMGDIDSRRKADAMQAGLRRFGISEELGKTGRVEKQDLGRFEQGLRTLAETDEEGVKEMMETGTKFEKFIAAAAVRARDPNKKLTQEQLRQAQYAARMVGLQQTEGDVIEGGKIDEEMVGAETVKGMREINTSLVATREVLELLARKNGLNVGR